MPRQRSSLWLKAGIPLGMLLVLLFVFAYLSRATYDSRKVHPSIRDIPKPYQNVIAHYYLDGGSIGLFIIDKYGRTNMFGLPVSPTINDLYTNFFIGDPRNKTNPGINLQLDNDTKEFAIELIDKYAVDDINKRAALMNIRGSLKDRLNIYLP